jgi:hypothetical protein
VLAASFLFGGSGCGLRDFRLRVMVVCVVMVSNDAFTLCCGRNDAMLFLCLLPRAIVMDSAFVSLLLFVCSFPNP